MLHKAPGARPSASRSLRVKSMSALVIGADSAGKKRVVTVVDWVYNGINLRAIGTLD